MRNVHLEYSGGVRVFSGLSLNVGFGATLIIGSNGSGKTSILRLISGLIPHFYKARVNGFVRVLGVDPTRNPDAITGFVAYMNPDPESHVTGCTGWDEAAMPPAMLGLPRREVFERALQALESCLAKHLSSKPTHEMSSGELQRVGLAGLLAMKPKLLLLDEPLGYIDEDSTPKLVNALKNLLSQNISLIIATHKPWVFRELKPRVITLLGETIIETSIDNIEYRNILLTEKKHEVGSEAVVSLRNVWFKYPRSKRFVVRGLNLEFRRSEVVALVGPNGAGKTTILKLAAGILKPSKGFVVRRGSPAYLPPNPLLLFVKPSLREEIEFLGGDVGVIEELGLERIAYRGVASLSTGELRMAGIALLVSLGSDLILMDEPTNGLDSNGRRIVARVIDEVASRGSCVVVATHDLDWAYKTADRVVRIGS